MRLCDELSWSLFGELWTELVISKYFKFAKQSKHNMLSIGLHHPIAS